MTSIDVSRALVPAADHEDVVKGGFWNKVRRTLGRVPFLDHAVAAYFAAVDPSTPVHVKATLFAALAYFVLPVDLVPDMIAGLGFTDDGTVLFLALQAIAPHLTEAHRERARAALAKSEPAERPSFFRNG
jgi:uncharacterized membrane protein YkvA (DUF1232 family)